MMTENQQLQAEMAEIKSLLLRSDKAVERAMVVLYDRQTRDEKSSQDTKHTNQRGFSAFHAKSGSYMACWVISGRHLTGKYIAKARSFAVHYTRQLVDEARAKKAREKANSLVQQAPAREQISRAMCRECLMPIVDDYCACRGYGD